MRGSRSPVATTELSRYRCEKGTPHQETEMPVGPVIIDIFEGPPVGEIESRKSPVSSTKKHRFLSLVAPGLSVYNQYIVTYNQQPWRWRIKQPKLTSEHPLTSAIRFV